jgi:hypothetical protein
MSSRKGKCLNGHAEGLKRSAPASDAYVKMQPSASALSGGHDLAGGWSAKGGVCAFAGGPVGPLPRPPATFADAPRNVGSTSIPAVYCVSSRSASSAIRPQSRPYDSSPGRLYRNSAKRQEG